MRDVHRIRAAVQDDRPAFGTWVQLGSPEICEIASRSGFDFVIIDMEHGSFGLDVAVNMIRAVETGPATPVVRVPDAGRSTILKVLDAGARGILVPNVGSRQTALDIVAASRFAPRGSRGACPCTRATAHGLAEWKSFVEWSDADVLVIALIETPEGLDSFAEIVAVPGLDAVGVGPFDLSQAMGLSGQWEHPEVQRKQAELIRLARSAGMEVMTAVFDSDPAVLREKAGALRRLGSRMIAVSGDRFLLSSSFSTMTSALADARRPGAPPAQAA